MGWCISETVRQWESEGAVGFRLPASGFRLPASGFRLPASGPLFILRCAQDEERAGREKVVHQAPSTVRSVNRGRKTGIILKLAGTIQKGDFSTPFHWLHVKEDSYRR